MNDNNRRVRFVASQRYRAAAASVLFCAVWRSAWPPVAYTTFKQRITRYHLSLCNLQACEHGLVMARGCHAVGCSCCSFSDCDVLLLSVAAPARGGHVPVLISRTNSTVEALATSRYMMSSLIPCIQQSRRVSFAGILHCRPRLEHGHSLEQRLNI